VKRAEVNQLLENYNESVQDYQRAKELDTSNQFGVDAKLREAKLKAKQNSKKDYYATMGVSKTCTEAELK
jgi:uncharacterized Fe-S cluster-containing protein